MKDFLFTMMVGSVFAVIFVSILWVLDHMELFL